MRMLVFQMPWFLPIYWLLLGNMWIYICRWKRLCKSNYTATPQAINGEICCHCHNNYHYSTTNTLHILTFFGGANIYWKCSMYGPKCKCEWICVNIYVSICSYRLIVAGRFFWWKGAAPGNPFPSQIWQMPKILQYYMTEDLGSGSYPVLLAPSLVQFGPFVGSFRAHNNDQNYSFYRVCREHWPRQKSNWSDTVW